MHSERTRWTGPTPLVIAAVAVLATGLAIGTVGVIGTVGASSPAAAATAAGGVDLSCIGASGGALYTTDSGLSVYENDDAIRFGNFPDDNTVDFGGSAVALSATGSAQARLDEGTGDETCLANVQATNPITVEPVGEADFVIESDVSEFAYRDPDWAAATGTDVAYDAAGSLTVTFESTGFSDGTTLYAVESGTTTQLDAADVSSGAVTLTLPAGTTDVDLRDNAVPTSSDTSVTTDEDTTYTFAKSDFPFSDSDGPDSLQSVTITSVPSTGTLYLDANDNDENDGEGVTAGQSIAASELTSGNLQYAPPQGRSGTGLADFEFEVSDGLATANSPSTMTIDVSFVNDPPIADGGGDRTVPVDTAVQLDAVQSTDDAPIPTYKWDVDGDGTDEYTTDRQAISHTYTEPGAYQVTLTVVDSGGFTDTDTFTVTVQDATAPIADAGANQTVQTGESVAFDGTGSTDDEGIASYEWDLDGDGTVDATGPTPNFTYQAVGSYTVTLTVTDDAGNTNSDTLTVTVEDGTAPTADAGSNRTVEVGQSIRLDGSGSSDNGNITSYRWDVGSDGVVDATGGTASYTFETVGNYTVALTVTDEAGNTDTDTVTITVEDTVPPTADAGRNQTVTVGETVTFDGTGSADNGTITSYEWDVDGDGAAEATGTTVNHTYSTAGTYQVTLTVTDLFGNTDTDTATVTVEAATDPSVTVSNQSYANGTDRITVDSYQFAGVGGSLTVWTVVNGSLDTQIGENLTAPGAGTDATVNLTTKLTANTTIAVTIHQNTEPTTANVIANDTATVTITEAGGPPTGSVTFANQTVANGTMNLTVASASASVNYTVSIRRGSPTGTSLATSRAFAGGTTQQGLDLSLTESLTANTTLYAVVEAADSGDQLANASATITVESDRADDPVEDYDFDDNDNIEIDELGAAAADFAQREISIAELAAVATRFAQDDG